MLKKLKILFPKKPPLLLTVGDPVLDAANNQEVSASKMLAGLTIMPSRPGGYALFGTKVRDTAVEVHTTAESLTPYLYTSKGKGYVVPKLMALTSKGIYDFTVIITAHPINMENVKRRYQEVREYEDNQEYLKLLDLLERWDMPGFGISQSRNLYVIANKRILPRSEEGGLGGKTVTYVQAGDILYSLIRRLPPRFRELGPDIDGQYRPLTYASPEVVISHDDYLLIEKVPTTYFKGGLINNEGMAFLLRKPVDVQMRFQFIKDTSRLFVTSCSRASGTPEQLDSIESELKELGGWKRIRGSAQDDAASYWLLGKPLPPSYGHREVFNWSSLEEPKGVLQQISEGLSPIGDPGANWVIGKDGVVPRKLDLSQNPNRLVTGPSKRTGKTLTVAAKVLSISPRIFWFDFSLSDMDKQQVWGSVYGGRLFQENLREAESFLLEEDPSRHPSPDQIALKRQELAIQYRQEVIQMLEEMLDLWYRREKVVDLPLIYRPVHSSSVAWLTKVGIFLEELPKYTTKWHNYSGQVFQIVGNDFSNLAELQVRGNPEQAAAAKIAGAQLLSYMNQGANSGLDLWVLTHLKEDPNVIMGGDVYPDWSVHLNGGLQSVATYHYQLILPATGEVLVENLDLSLKGEQDKILQILERLSPQEIRELKQQQTHANPNGHHEQKAVQHVTVDT